MHDRVEISPEFLRHTAKATLVCRTPCYDRNDAPFSDTAATIRFQRGWRVCAARRSCRPTHRLFLQAASDLTGSLVVPQFQCLRILILTLYIFSDHFKIRGSTAWVRGICVGWLETVQIIRFGVLVCLVSLYDTTQITYCPL